MAAAACRIFAAVTVLSCSFSARSAWAQSGDTFRYAEPFPGTLRTKLLQNQAATGAQLYGALGLLERELMPRVQNGGVVFLNGFDMLMGGVRIPGYCSVCGDMDNPDTQFRVFAADTYSLATGLALRTDEGWGVFTAAAVTYTRVAQGIEQFFARIGVPMVSAIGMPMSHLFLASLPFLTGPTQVIGGETTANLVSYVAGGTAEVFGTNIYVGFVGNSAGGGLYTNLTQKKLRLLLSTALTENLGDMTYLKAGFDGVSDGSLGSLGSLAEMFASSESSDESAKARPSDPTSSVYTRKVRLDIPRLTDSDQTTTTSGLALWTVHAQRTNLLGGLVDLSAAVGVRPVALLHEARVTLHTPAQWMDEDESALRLSASLGYVRLPPLYMLAQQPGGHLAFRLEGKIGNILSVSLCRNEPEILTSFPYAVDAWKMTFFADISSAMAEMLL